MTPEVRILFDLFSKHFLVLGYVGAIRRHQILRMILESEKIDLCLRRSIYGNDYLRFSKESCSQTCIYLISLSFNTVQFIKEFV